MPPSGPHHQHRKPEASKQLLTAATLRCRVTVMTRKELCLAASFRNRSRACRWVAMVLNSGYQSLTCCCAHLHIPNAASAHLRCAVLRCDIKDKCVLAILAATVLTGHACIQTPPIFVCLSKINFWLSQQNTLSAAGILIHIAVVQAVLTMYFQAA